MQHPDWYRSWRHEAVHMLIEKNRILGTNHGISRFPQWDYDLGTQSLMFSEAGKTIVTATVQVAGTTSKSARKRLWAWANESLPEDVTVDFVCHLWSSLAELYGRPDPLHVNTLQSAIFAAQRGSNESIITYTNDVVA